MRRRLQQYSVAAVNLRKLIFRGACEMQRVARAKKHGGVQFLKCIAPTPNNAFGHCQPMPKARALIAFKQVPHRCRFLWG